MPAPLVSRSVSALAAVAAAATFAFTGCAQNPVLESPQTTTDNFSKAKAAGIRPVAVATFTAERDSLARDARQLQDTLQTELQGAGLYSSQSKALVQGHLVSSDMAATSGSVAARFIVTVDGGKVVYDRELRTTSTWRADANRGREQAAVYSKLVGLLFTDPGFRNAVPR